MRSARGPCGAAFHIDSSSRWDLLLANVENLLDGWGGPLAVEVVVNGPAVEVLTLHGVNGARLQRLAARGVKFLACSNSLRAQGIPSEQVLPQAQVISAGVVHLTARQLSGWAYIKP